MKITITKEEATELVVKNVDRMKKGIEMLEESVSAGKLDDALKMSEGICVICNKVNTNLDELLGNSAD